MNTLPPITRKFLYDLCGNYETNALPAQLANKVGVFRVWLLAYGLHTDATDYEIEVADEIDDAVTDYLLAEESLSAA